MFDDGPEALVCLLQSPSFDLIPKLGHKIRIHSKYHPADRQIATTTTGVPQNPHWQKIPDPNGLWFVTDGGTFNLHIVAQ